uniref:Uncharacterized protein n=1 Tax=Podoviridae sp. ctG4L18 TaxID=2825234 RepID=A0A8S5UNQ8_9CAUD|nr:MAG TPA: hypothetical protein [Podoviridae sp. ctG4L18]DAO74389.1 MAG TPA: hypothetical protein [Bacteriophage sp.]
MFLHFARNNHLAYSVLMIVVLLQIILDKT